MSDDRIAIPGSTLKARRSKLNAFQERGRKSSAESLNRPSSTRTDQPTPDRKPRRRTISPASPAQRAYVREVGRCMVCGGQETEDNRHRFKLTFAHWWPRGRGGCDSPLCGGVLCIQPGGTGCHDQQERGEIDLLSIIVDHSNWEHYRPHLQHALEHARPVELIEKLAGARIEWSETRTVLTKNDLPARGEETT